MPAIRCPRRTCAARVTVVCWPHSCVCVCLSVRYHTSGIARSYILSTYSIGIGFKLVRRVSRMHVLPSSASACISRHCEKGAHQHTWNVPFATRHLYAPNAHHFQKCQLEDDMHSRNRPKWTVSGQACGHFRAKITE